MNKYKYICIYIYTYIHIYTYIYIYTNLKRHKQNSTHAHFNLILNSFKLIKVILFRCCCYYRYNKIDDLTFITYVGTQRKYNHSRWKLIQKRLQIYKLKLGFD